jgi:hypothetical protein
MHTRSGEDCRDSTQTLHCEAREVLRDIEQRPHLLTRIKLSGAYFPRRALDPFVIVGRVRSLFVEISEDSLNARAYFDAPLPEAGTIRFGYGSEIELGLAGQFSHDDVQRLDPARLPKNVRLPGDR